MEVTLPADLKNQVDQEIAAGHFNSSDELIERAVRLLLAEEQRAAARIEALRSIGDAVDRAGLYERVFIPGQ